jgi:PAS domain S-box-containing protein
VTKASHESGETTRSAPLETRFQELKRYVALGPEDAALLAALRPLAAPHFARIAQEFYDRIREHEDAHAVFKDEAQIARLNRSLQLWMERVLSGVYDEAYFEETLKIGRVHVRVGLPQRYMFTAMALIRVALTRIAESELGRDSTPTCEALTRLLDLELAMMMESYREDFIARVQRVERLERQELNRTLVRTEHRYVNAVELARALFVGLDGKGTIRLFNREAERVTGFERDEVLGRLFAASLLQEDLVERFGADIERAARGESVLGDAVKMAIRTKSGKYRDVRWQFAYAPSQAGDDVFLFAIGQDMTEELALQAKTKQHEKLAAVGTLAAGLAHEIRNPLNGAQLHVSFLERAIRRSGGDTDMLEAVKVVDEEIKRLAALVTEFLDFARPRPPTIKPTSARSLSERVLQLMAPKAREARVELALDFPSRDTTLSVDPSKMEQVLLNLLANAVEALAPENRDGHVVLRVRRQPRSVFFEVEDDGPGLSNPRAPIFDPFFSTKAQGTGLGLAITHRIVTDHGGDIAVESRPGRTVFRATLPIDPE